MGADPLQQGVYGYPAGLPTGYAAGLQSLLTPLFNKKVGGNYLYTPKDYLMAALAGNAGNHGIIPSLLGGLGQAYLYNKQAGALNEQAQQEAIMKQQEVQAQQDAQRKLAEYYGVKPEYLDAAAQVAKPEILKEFLNQGQTGAEVGNTNTYLKNINMPILEGLPSREYQNAIMNTYNTLLKNIPDINEQNMKNQILQQTMPGEIQATNAKNQYTTATTPGAIQGTNAENQAKSRFSVPQAQAKLQGTNLENIHQGQVNKYYPRMQETTMRNSNINTHINQQKEQRLRQEAQGLNQFSQTLNQLNSQTQDPNEFRTKAIQTLMQTPVSQQGKQQLMQDIDTYTVLKMKQPKKQGVSGQLPPKQGLFGLKY